MPSIVQTVRKQLQEEGSLEVQESSRRFFKEAVQVHGVKSIAARRILKASLITMKGLSKKQVFNMAEELWQSGYLEEGNIAAEWVYAQRKDYTATDMDIFEHWIDYYITNWANCDTLCNHSVGTLVTMYPELITRLKNWTASENRWKKRSAAVTLIIPARQGLFLNDIFDIAGNLLVDPDDMVQKGYGWMLKAASQAHSQEVFAYVMLHKKIMPRTALRYAIEKLSKEQRNQAMKK